MHTLYLCGLSSKGGGEPGNEANHDMCLQFLKTLPLKLFFLPDMYTPPDGSSLLNY